MKKQRPFLILLFFLIITPVSYSQSFIITEPTLEFDTLKMSVSISYDIINKDQSDIFFVFVEIRHKDGSVIGANSFKGDVGDSIKPGKNKHIVWVPEEDAIFLDEDVSIELKGERYERLFNKGSMVLQSAIVPGLGQTKIKNGKPWWITSIPVYGAMAGGVYYYLNYQTTYNAYKTETDPIERSDLWDKSQKQRNNSGVLFISAAALWVTNIVWVAATPNKYRPLQHAKLTVGSIPNKSDRITFLSFRVAF